MRFKNKKASVFMILFFVIIVIGIVYMVGLQFQSQKETAKNIATEGKTEAQLGSYAELVKNYGFHSLRAAGFKASLDSAEAGAGKEFWVDYSSAFVPNLDVVKKDISDRALVYCNQYLDSLDKTSFGKLIYEESGEFGEVKVWLEPDMLAKDVGETSTEVDEGFIISSRGKEDALVEGGDESRKIDHKYTSSIYPIRYWFVYRIIKQWIDESVIQKELCQEMKIRQGSCGLGQEGCAPMLSETDPELFIDNLLRLAVAELETSLGDSVDCDYTIDCAYVNTEINYAPSNCDDPAICREVAREQGMSDCQNPECKCSTDPCEYNDNLNISCFGGDCPDGFCPGGECPDKQFEVSYDPPIGQLDCDVKNVPGVPGECYGFGQKHTVSFITNLQCVDNKYQLPTGADTYEKLLFNILMHFSLKHEVEPLAPPCIVECGDLGNCECPPDLPGCQRCVEVPLREGDDLICKLEICGGPCEECTMPGDPSNPDASCEEPECNPVCTGCDRCQCRGGYMTCQPKCIEREGSCKRVYCDGTECKTDYPGDDPNLVECPECKNCRAPSGSWECVGPDYTPDRDCVDNSCCSHTCYDILGEKRCTRPGGGS